jgi:prepilin-type N-terminal cleavage/methylation domain-containing protein
MKKGRPNGFTLIEMSAVVAIVALLTALTIATGIGVVAGGRMSATRQKMATLDQALLNYRLTHDRLPCPANASLGPGSANFGVEAANPGSCTGGTPAASSSMNNAAGTAVSAAEGSVPALSLGLPADMMLDGWGNQFRYAVDVSLTTPGMFVLTPSGAACGPITVKDANGNARTTTAIYALVSHGPNGFGAYTKSGAFTAGPPGASEQTNCHCNASGNPLTYSATYVQKIPQTDSTSASTYFDDIVLFRERWQMRALWDKSGAVCPALYVADTGHGRIEKFDHAGHYLAQISSSQFTSVTGVAVDGSGNVFVADGSAGKIKEFDPSGNYLAQFNASGSGDGEFSAPAHLAFDAIGWLWVADQGNYRVQRLMENGNWMQTIGGGPLCVSCTSALSCSCTNQAGLNGGFGAVQSVAADPVAGGWALDKSANTAQKFDADGNFIFQMGGSGSGNGQFSTPLAIATDMAGNLFVADTGNNRIQKFDANGNYLLQFGGSGSGNGQMSAPAGVGVDALANVFVADTANNRIEEFDALGNYIGQFGASGSGNGQFSSPGAIAVAR